MDLISIINAIADAKAPIITGIIIIVGYYFNLKTFKSDNRANFEIFKNDIREKIKDDVRDITESLKSVINGHDVQFLSNDKKLEALNTTIEEIKTGIAEQTQLLKKHDTAITMFSNVECFKSEIQETVNHSLEILKGDDLAIAQEYLYIVSQEVCKMIDYVQLSGLVTLSRTGFDALITNSTKTCKDKFGELYGSDKAQSYFKSINHVCEYKTELFNLIEDKKVNNLERRYRTLTLHWFGTLCANFLITMYLKRRKGDV